MRQLLGLSLIPAAGPPTSDKVSYVYTPEPDRLAVSVITAGEPWSAATAIALGVRLVTRDDECVELAGLAVVRV